MGRINKRMVDDWSTVNELLEAGRQTDAIELAREIVLSGLRGGSAPGPVGRAALRRLYPVVLQVLNVRGSRESTVRV